MPPVLLALVTFLSVAALFGGATVAVSHRHTLRARLLALTAPPTARPVRASVLTADQPQGLLERLLIRLGRRPPPRTAGDAPPQRARTAPDRRMLLLQAGIRRPNAATILMGACVLLAVSMLFVGAIMATLFGPALLPAALVFAVAGYAAPGAFVARMVRKRRVELQRGLPDAIDLLLLCVEAGLGLNPALLRVAEERTSAGVDPIGDELMVLAKELQVGLPRREALRNFAERTGVDEVRALTAQLIQSERLGSPIGGALRAQSQSIRVRRRQQAEELANKTQVKLLFPLMFFIFPSVMVVVLMPAVLRLMVSLQSLTP